MELSVLYFQVFIRVCFSEVAGCSHVFLLKMTRLNTENTKRKTMKKWIRNLDIKNC